MQNTSMKNGVNVVCVWKSVANILHKNKNKTGKVFMTKKINKDCMQQDLPPQWCKYCCYFGYDKNWNACYRGFFTTLVNGPRVVSFDGYCEHFRYAKKYKNTKSR